MRKIKKNYLICSLITSGILHIILISLIFMYSLIQNFKFNGEKKNKNLADVVMVDFSESLNKDEKNKKEQDKHILKYVQIDKNNQHKKEKKDYIKNNHNVIFQKKQILENTKNIKQLQKQSEKNKEFSKLKKEKLSKVQVSKKITTNTRIKEKVVKNFKLNSEKKVKKTEDTNKLKNKVKITKDANNVNLKTEFIKNKKSIDILLDDLTTSVKNKKNNITLNNNVTQSSDLELNMYVGKIKEAIQNKFYDSDLYRNRICELQLKLLPNGELFSILPKNILNNDPRLCDAAIRAAKLATIPKPPTIDIYNTFNNTGSIIIFKP
ncbi:Protein TolA [Candidatus Providencia siddallii]|uniref:Protein TolA n=1 Tax=Candidatus Providencia siddallii TaxID=1715285 RepID=A0A0M6WAH6_9GAMM|nr:Protein TolA [Candidatus Providencia siddallii]